MKKAISFLLSLILFILAVSTAAPVGAESNAINGIISTSRPGGAITLPEAVGEREPDGQQHGLSTDAVWTCLYVPGVSVPAQMPADVLNPPTPTPLPSATPPAATKVDARKTALQLRVYSGLWNAVNEHYVYKDFRGRDWNAIGSRYKALIQRGLSDDDFYAAMQAMLSELGDEHSYFQSPTQIKAEQAELASRYNFVGIGTLLVPIPSTDHAVIITVFPGSPAAEAGLLPHDSLLRVDGGPIRDKTGTSRTLGLEGTTVTLTVQRPGEPSRDVTLTRRRVTGMLPIDYCLIPNTRIGYIFLPTLLDETMSDQTREALRKMTADGPLDGLILDNRMNGGGLGSVAKAIMGLFTSGLQGYYISRTSREPLTLQPENVGGSQTVPMVVLVDTDTVSFGEIVSGVLRLSGRAKVVGRQTLGNVEQLRAYNFEDGSRAWIASDTFEPLGLTNGTWEETGIIPDVSVPTRWDLFTDANDPALAKAVELLLRK
jgi:carboxyl-terminal processing protease